MWIWYKCILAGTIQKSKYENFICMKYEVYISHARVKLCFKEIIMIITSNTQCQDDEMSINIMIIIKRYDGYTTQQIQSQKHAQQK